MTEKNIQEELSDIINNMEDINNPEESDVKLFQDIKLETPFQEPVNTPAPTFTYSKTASVNSGDDEYTVIGSSTKIDGNVTCGGNLLIKGHVKGSVAVAGNAQIFGSIEGDIEAVDATFENGSKINGDVHCKNDVNVAVGSSITGNVEAKNAYVDATIQGTVTTASDLRLSGTAVIVGDIATGNIAVASGASINGQLSIKR